jgi:hypothetical protein
MDTRQTTRRLAPWSLWWPWPPAGRPRRGWQPRHPGALLVAIKTIHTLAWFSIESCMVYLLYAGFAKRSDRRTALAAAVVGGESLIFAANGFRCPLTQLADSLGARSGSVTDIYLPGWFAHNLPAIHAPLLVLAAFLHGRNLWQQRKRRLEGETGDRKQDQERIGVPGSARVWEHLRQNAGSRCESRMLRPILTPSSA